MRELKSRSKVRLCVLVTALGSASPALAQQGWRGSGPPHQEQRQQNGGGWRGPQAPQPAPPPQRGPSQGWRGSAPPPPPPRAPAGGGWRGSGPARPMYAPAAPPPHEARQWHQGGRRQ